MGRPSSPPTERSALQPSSAGNSFTPGSPGYYDPPPYRPHDPRSSSTQSLLPSLSNGPEGRRTLLLVYLHGFMGNDSSFQSFPAHVHHFLKDALAPTHVIHSKIYPRYKTYKAIDVARDNFSKWLEPHESPTTDVVLLGHSMGGVLAAEIVLQRNSSTTYGYPLRHRILGTISLDAPLLGLHPGIVVSGIASLFRPAAAPTQREDSESSASSSRPPPSLSPDPSLYAELSPPSGATSPSIAFPPPPINPNAPADPHFNPAFFNDVAFVDRGWFRNIAHFAMKHKEENLFGAAASHIMSHLEFGSCLADYTGLKTRYQMIRELENVPGPNPPRVRFVNYYTASTGPPKKPKSPKLTPTTSPPAENPPNENTHLNPASVRPSLDGAALSNPSSRPSTPRISIEDHSDRPGSPAVLQILDPVPEPDDDEPIPTPTPNENEPPAPGSSQDTADPPAPSQDTAGPTLPEIPPIPTPPVTPDLASITDKDARKLAEKDAKRALKTYAQAVKDRDKALRERDKALEKRRRQSAKDAEKRAREEHKAARDRDKEERKREQREMEEMEREMRGMSLEAERGGEKKKKEGKFCMLPGKVGGVRDPAWVRVYMEGVDEVGAHTGLFFPGPHYEGLVGDVGERIVGWVKEDASGRAAGGLS